MLAMGMMMVMATVKSPLTQIRLGRGEEVHAALGPRRERMWFGDWTPSHSYSLCSFHAVAGGPWTSVSSSLKWAYGPPFLKAREAPRIRVVWAGRAGPAGRPPAGKNPWALLSGFFLQILGGFC